MLLLFFHISMVMFVVIINIFVIKELMRKKQLLSPYMFFYVMIIVELIGPLTYYYVLNGESYRNFSDSALLTYYLISVFVSIVILFQIKARRKISIKIIKKRIL